MSLVMLLSLILAAAGFSQSRQSNQSRPFAFSHVTVIDATGAEAAPDMTVVIIDGRITALGKTGKVPIPPGAEVLDSTGKFLIPGLWDMHVHTSDKSFLSLFIANGVTGVRDMGGSQKEFASLKEWRAQIDDKTLLGPRIVAAGTHVDGPNGRPNSTLVANASEGRKAVNDLKQSGADFIKVYSMLSREAYFAIADEAKKQGLAFAGHVPASVSSLEASAAGQRSMEHVFGVFTACSSREVELKNEEMAAVAESGFRVFVQAEIGGQLRSLRSYDDKKSAALFSQFVKNGTWQVPTLAGWQTLAVDDSVDINAGTPLEYVPLERRGRWKDQRANLVKSLGPEYLANRKALFDHQLKVVGAMHRAGVQLMAGTDTAAPYLIPGFSLHDELALLVRAGLTPMDALQAATRNPARFLGLQHLLGTVEAGKIADLVLLEANPLEDIRNTRRIAAVVLNGRFLGKASLQKMLADVRAASARQ